MEYVGRVSAQISPPLKHLVRYYGVYSNAARGKRRRDQTALVQRDTADTQPAPHARSRRREHHARLPRGSQAPKQRTSSPWWTCSARLDAV